MAKYEVTLTESQFYTITVEASSADEAEEIAWDELRGEIGIDKFYRSGSSWEDTAYVEEVN